MSSALGNCTVLLCPKSESYRIVGFLRTAPLLRRLCISYPNSTSSKSFTCHPTYGSSKRLSLFHMLIGCRSSGILWQASTCLLVGPQLLSSCWPTLKPVVPISDDRFWCAAKLPNPVYLIALEHISWSGTTHIVCAFQEQRKTRIGVAVTTFRFYKSFQSNSTSPDILRSWYMMLPQSSPAYRVLST